MNFKFLIRQRHPATGLTTQVHPNAKGTAFDAGLIWEDSQGEIFTGEELKWLVEFAAARLAQKGRPHTRHILIEWDNLIEIEVAIVVAGGDQPNPFNVNPIYRPVSESAADIGVNNNVNVGEGTSADADRPADETSDLRDINPSIDAMVSFTPRARRDRLRRLSRFMHVTPGAHTDVSHR